MAWRGGRNDDFEDDDLEEDLDADEADLSDPDADLRDDDSTAEDTVPCPACGAEVFEDSPRCPACGEYVTADGGQAGSRPLWVVVTAAICLAMAVWIALAGF
jgi:hypothetical protein